MKKLIVIALAVVMALSLVLVLAACGGETVTGECKYENAWVAGKYYGVKVDVTVKNGTITKVVLHSEEETGWTRTSADNGTTWKVHDQVEAAYQEWLDNEIVGKTVEEVKAWVAVATKEGQSVTKGPILKLSTGETAQQSSARIIVAVQDALSKLAK